MAQVVLENLSKIYSGNAKVVDDVNFTVEDREFVVLVGPSGCGKSTTLRMIAGLEEITEGTISIDGKVVNDQEPKDRDIAMVFQNYALYPHMTVYENMAFGLKLRKHSKEDIKKRVGEAAKILDLEEYLNRKPKALSGGQRQRVAVGRAIVRHPKVFLFDEPLSNLDAKLRVQMRTEISKLHKKLNATMIYVTHDQTEAMTMGDKIVVMKDGVVQQIDTPLKLYNKPQNQFVAGFIGSPSMNFIEGNLELNKNYRFTSGENLTVDLPERFTDILKNYKEKSVTFGIRPEFFSLDKGENYNDSAFLNTEIEVVEPLGNETFLYFSINEKQLIARVDSDLKINAGDKIKMYMNNEKFYLFDKQGERLIKN